MVLIINEEIDLRIIKKITLEKYWKNHPNAENSLRYWYLNTLNADWKSSQDILKNFPKAKILNSERARFAIHGGRYRLIVSIFFPAQAIFIKFIGTHAEYDKINALTVDLYKKGYK